MAIDIINHGDKKRARKTFKCLYCGCIFRCEMDEYARLSDGKDWAACPECGLHTSLIVKEEIVNDSK